MQDQSSTLRVGVDTGGTFTDVIALTEGRLHSWKLPSTPEAYEQAVLAGAEAVCEGEAAQLIHSSTVATNALLEKKGARVALLTTAGFRDVLEIGRQNRPDLYALCPSRPAPLVPRERRFEILERVGSEGQVICPLDESAFPELLKALEAQRVEAVAVVFLFSFLYPAHERRVGEWLRDRGYSVSLSHEVLPEFREYERSSTTAINAYVQPAMTRYLDRLQAKAFSQNLHDIKIMQSNGGTLSPARAGAFAVNTLLSGPAAGLRGALKVAAASDLLPNQRLITFDMGGTSTDVALLDGGMTLATSLLIEGYPVGVPMVDVHTVGAGGGSVSSVDSGGALQVGPASAGAWPGPAAYGAGGPATVTDAHVVLGNLRPENFLQGRMALDREASGRVLSELGCLMGGVSAAEAAEGVLRLVNLHMENAIRVISVQRGYHPGDFSLIGFGGAGGLHVFSLAEALQIPRVVVPCHPGVLSALGAALSPLREEVSCTLMRRWHPDNVPALRQRIIQLQEALLARMPNDVNVSFGLRLDMRYAGQSHELSVQVAFDELANAKQRFHELHETRYGHAETAAPVELVTLRVEAEGPEPVCDLPALPRRLDTDPDPQIGERIYERGLIRRGDRIKGPALIVEDFHTVLLPKGWRVCADRVGNLIGTRCGEGGE